MKIDNNSTNEESQKVRKNFQMGGSVYFFTLSSFLLVSLFVPYIHI
jgi:hypothetical protein